MPPTLPSLQDESPESFQNSAGLVLVSNAANAPQVDVALAGQSTYNADINYDGKVNIADIVAFENLLGAQRGDANYSASADPSGSGSIDLGDFGIMNAQYGLSISQTKTASPAAGTAPATAVSAAMSATAKKASPAAAAASPNPAAASGNTAARVSTSIQSRPQTAGASATVSSPSKRSATAAPAATDAVLAAAASWSPNGPADNSALTNKQISFKLLASLPVS